MLLPRHRAGGAARVVVVLEELFELGAAVVVGRTVGDLEAVVVEGLRGDGGLDLGSGATRESGARPESWAG